MNKQPFLRFKEFNDDYKEYKIQDFASRVIMGATPSTKNIEYWNSRDHPFITIPDLNFSYINKVSRFVSNKGLNKRQSVILPKGSVMYSCVATIGKTGITTEESITNQQIYSIVPNEKIASEYLLMLLNANYNYIYNLIPQSSTTKIITLDGFKNINFYIPSLPEQQKIANFFQNIDKQITLTKDNLTLLENRKKYLIQEMFCSTKDTPSLRFKEFSGDYQEHNLNSICESITVGGTPSTKNKEYWGFNIPWINSGLINLDIITKNNINKFITELGLKKSSAKLMKKNTVLMAMTGATAGKISLLKCEATGNQSVMGFCGNSKYLNHNYLYFLLKAKERDLFYLQHGSSQGGIKKSIMQNYSISIPSLPEQQKVANFFQNIDKQITLTKDNLTLLENRKKYLLQEMFI